MAEKIFNNVRTLLLHDTLAAWQGVEETFVPKKGEVVLMTVPATDTTEAAVLIKVGDNATTLKNLPYVSALAADVLAQCKDEASLKTFINGVISEAGIASSAAMDALTTRVSAAEKTIGEHTTAISNLQTALGEGGSVDTQIANAIEALKLGETYAAKTHGHAISDVAGLSEAIADAKKAGTDAAEALGTYKTTNDEAVKANTDAIAAIKDSEEIDSFADVVAALSGKQDTIPENTYDAYGSASAVDQKLTTFESTVSSTYETKTDAASKLAEAKGYTNTEVKKVQDEVDAIELDLGDVDGLTTTDKTVVGAINEVLTAVGTGGAAAIVTMTTETTTEGALKSYTIKQGETTVGVIDIPKDMVVQSGSIVENPEGMAEGVYIKLVLANVAEPLYINVAQLIDIYTAAANATQVQVAVSNTGEISATLVNGAVTTDIIADSAVITSKIANANVTKEKLSTAVQASLDKADAAAPQTALDSEVQRATEAEKGLGDRITALEGVDHSHENADVLDGIDADKVAAWDAAEANAIAAAKTETENQVKTLADGAVATNAKAIEDIETDLTTIGTDIDNLESAMTQAQTDIATKANDADLAAVAKSGLMEDLSIGVDTEIFFVAGGAANVGGSPR